MRAKTICLINQKGGCGKSSTVFHLSGELARSGLRVLVVDMDPQGSLGQAFFGSALVECLEPIETVAALYSCDAICTPQQLVVTTPIVNIDIIRSNQALAQYNHPLVTDLGMSQFELASCLAKLSDYDIILIDCPPNLYQCSWNALLAADYIVIPVPPEDFGTQGLRCVYQAISQAKQLNPQLQLLGQVITRTDKRLVVHRTYESRLRQLYQGNVFTVTLSEASAFKVALACRQPVSQYSPRCRAAKQIRQLKNEIYQRMEQISTKSREVA